ncbi:MAG: hypothetical protein CSYNP_03030 [Syntrophus sp. SKADARSKE-3]|nr:hypothetical protein [Syntrophus sp. SKADARSKE-3]
MKIPCKHSLKRYWLLFSLVGFMVMLWHLAFMVEPAFSKKASSKGKASAPIDISYTVPAQNDSGDRIPVNITVKTLSDVSSLKLEIKTEEGLSLFPSGAFSKSYGSRLRNDVVTENVTIVPLREGRLYFNVFVSGIFNEKNMIHVISIPVNVGMVNAKTTLKSRQTTKDAKGQNIIIMPAEEKPTK